MVKTSNPHGPCCPYCGHVAYVIPDITQDTGAHKDCEQCERKFFWWSVTGVTYYTRDLECGELLAAAFAQKEAE